MVSGVVDHGVSRMEGMQRVGDWSGQWSGYKHVVGLAPARRSEVVAEAVQGLEGCVAACPN